jgi:hypothetical protein
MQSGGDGQINAARVRKSFEKPALQFGLFWYSGGVLPGLLSVQMKS